ncbi:MAG: glycosyltransferase family 4 protein [Hyphomicrobiales bacterium]
MPLRIAVVTQAYRPAVGGVTEHVDAVARGLRARGHHVTVITSRFAGDGLPEPGVVRIGRNLVVPYNGAENNVTVGLGLGRRLAETLERGAFDVIHVHCPLSPTLPLLALRAARAPVVGTFHTASTSDLPFRLLRAPLRWFYDRMARVIAVSDAARDDVTRHFPGPVDVIPNGVDLGRFRPGLPRLARFDDGVPNLLFVGRFDPRKGLPELLRAAAILAREGRAFRLVLVGDGRLRPRLERMAGGVLRGRVHFEGRVEHVRLPRYYATADVFCSPATSGESFGLVLLEAMAAGAPVVATTLPGYRCVVTPGEDGLLVPPRDADALAGALRRLLDDAALRRRIAARGVETARRFGWEAIVDRLVDVYEAVTGRDAASGADAPAPRAAAEPAPASV